MAKGRTVSAKELTDQDVTVIETCSHLSKILKSCIKSTDGQKVFQEKFGKTNLSRDAGAGRGAGKLQRDALCTRGTTANLPISNRNLRWHPLVAMAQEHPHIKSVERLEIDKDKRMINFIIRDKKKKLISYPPDQVHTLEQRFGVLDEHWVDHEDELANWEDDDWTPNSCLIPVSEACDWQDSVETFTSLGLSILSQFFESDLDSATNQCSEYIDILNTSNKSQIEFNFTTKLSKIKLCPVCLEPLSSKLDQFRKSKRIDTWQPTWKQNKRNEGEDSSIQVMHVNPLNELEFMHNAQNVKYGHRWCNVAMTDHSLEETLQFMNHVVKMHK